MKRISLIMPYYDNPEMLHIHLANWRGWPRKVSQRFEFILVDDGSPNHPAAEELVKAPALDDLDIKCFRVPVDKPWHQHAARNIGAHEAKGNWLLLTDMDHLVPQSTAEALLKIDDRCGTLNIPDVFTFTRRDAPGLEKKMHPKTGEEHPHPNSFCMTKDTYWTVGGYDEDFCGIYGTDGMFRKRLWSIVNEVYLPEALVRYPREFVADAATNTLPRKEGRDPNAKKDAERRKTELGRRGVISTLTMPYVKAYPTK